MIYIILSIHLHSSGPVTNEALGMNLADFTQGFSGQAQFICLALNEESLDLAIH